MATTTPHEARLTLLPLRRLAPEFVHVIAAHHEILLRSHACCRLLLGYLPGCSRSYDRHIRWLSTGGSLRLFVLGIKVDPRANSYRYHRLIGCQYIILQLRLAT